LPGFVGNKGIDRTKIRSFFVFIAFMAAGIASHAQPQTAPAVQPVSINMETTVTNPVANPASIVILGKARFTVLTPQMIRMEWAEDGKFEDHASLVFLNRNLPVPKFTKEISNDGRSLTITTEDLKLSYNLSADDCFTDDNLSISLSVGGHQTVWHPGMTDPENLKGTTRTLDGALGSKTAQEGIEPGLVSRSGWAVVDDSTRPLFDSSDFRFLQGEKSPWPWAIERPAGKRRDLYFFGYGHDYRKALGDYVRVAGRIPLPPRFAFGAWWSRFWAYSDQEILDIVHGFHENDTPLDVFVIDMDWHLNEQELKAAGSVDQSNGLLGWTGYTWDKELFPDPPAFLDKLHEEGLKTSLNLHPASGVQPWEDAYPAMAKAMGVDPMTKKFIPFDITDKKYATNYMDILHHPLEKQGIDFWWLDWQSGPETKMENVTATWWLNYVHFTDQQREGRRPLLFHRWGGLGNHRYQIGFSGDVISVWPSLAFQPWFTATAANVGYAYWSHDIGGHLPGSVDPELYARWVQFGTFSPMLRTHTTKNPDSERRPWAYPEPYSAVLRSSFQLRYALQPYLYTEGHRTYESGVAFVHPLYYDWPEANEAYDSQNEYMFGDQILAAPVVTPGDTVSGLATESVWLPTGEWIEWPTGAHFTGPVKLNRSFSIDQVPIYLKAGSIVPMQPPMLYTGQKPVDPLIVNVWRLEPGAHSSYSLYEDSGEAELYQKGVYTNLSITAAQTGDTLKVEIGPVQGHFQGMLQHRAYELRLPADWPPASVAVNGVPVQQATKNTKGWRYDGNTLTTFIPIASTNVASKVTIEVHRAPGMTARRAELNGFPGQMTRLRAVYQAMRDTSPAGDATVAVIDAYETGDRIGYHPERTAAEIAHFHEVLPKAQASVREMDETFDAQVEEKIRKYAPQRWVPGALDVPELKKSRTANMRRAAKLMEDTGK
jgi:alpha-glucosidase (family GH31 glycosyl hydrolase)